MVAGLSDIDALLAAREIQDLGDGRLVLAGRPLLILHWLDARLEALTRLHGAAMMRVPTLISHETLDRAGYFEAFGDTATAVDPGGEQPAYLLTPALCYHVYPILANRRLDAPSIVGCGGRCFRKERTPAPSLSRLWEFTMREVIFVGTRPWVEAERGRWIARIEVFAASLGLVGRIEVAADPFFAGAARGRMLMQQLKELKYEFRMRVGNDDSVEAVASFNLHETFFGTRFGMTTSDGLPAWSGCVAFGLERWLLALVAQGRLGNMEALAGAS